MELLLCKVALTCLVIWLMMCFIVAVTEDRVKNKLPDSFYLVGFLNILVGLGSLIIVFVSFVWIRGLA